MGSGRTGLKASGAILALLLCTQAAAAQQGSNVQSYPADYFAPYHPADAYDMVRKLPGFELVDVDDEIRGFSESRGNILIDGRIPSGKQESLEQMLRRIPAASVLRIELVRGGASGSGAGAFELLANIVRRDGHSFSRSFQAGTTIAPVTGARPDFRADFSRQQPGRRLEASVKLETDVDDDSGKGGIITVDEDGTTARFGRDEREVQRNLAANVEYKLPLGGGDAVTNIAVARERASVKIRTREQAGMVTANERERLWTAEAGTQIDMHAGGGRLAALLVQRLGWLASEASEGDEQFRNRSRTSETIGRAEYRQGKGQLELFGSIEAAINGLNAKSALTIGGAPVPLPGSRAKIREHRAEAAVGAAWKPIAGTTVEPSLRLELSDLRSSGDRPGHDSFLFLKPRLRASWNAHHTSFQATIEREAAQLDFEDYVASVELDRDDVLAGAASLRPPVSWSVSFRLEQQFWDSGSISLSLQREWIANVIDRVIVALDDELLDAIGNIGSGRRRTIRAELTAPLERLGLAGMELRGSLTFRRSRVDDPVTGKQRIISEDRPFEGELSLSHELPGGRWSWGADASLSHRETEFRLDERRRERKGTAVGAYVEFRPSARWRLRAEVENLTSRPLVDQRLHFVGTRATSRLESVETRRIETAPIFSLSLRNALGGSAQ